MNTPSVSPVPQGMHTVTPHLVCGNAAAAIDFYVRAFGATEMLRMPGPEGRIVHAQVRIGDSVVMLVDAHPEWFMREPNSYGGTPVVLHLQVPDVDAFHARAVAAGAENLMAPEDMFWGDRYGRVRDPDGHVWAIASHVRDVSPQDLMAGAARPCPDSVSRES